MPFGIIGDIIVDGDLIRIMNDIASLVRIADDVLGNNRLSVPAEVEMNGVATW